MLQGHAGGEEGRLYTAAPACALLSPGWPMLSCTSLPPCSAELAVQAAQNELAGAEAGDGRDASNRSLQERLADAQNAQVGRLLWCIVYAGGWAGVQFGPR